MRTTTTRCRRGPGTSSRWPSTCMDRDRLCACAPLLLRSGDGDVRAGADAALGLFYGTSELVLSPSAAADDSLRALGIPAERIARWDRGVDTERFLPDLRERGRLPGAVSVLYSGRVTVEKGAHLL